MGGLTSTPLIHPCKLCQMQQNECTGKDCSKRKILDMRREGGSEFIHESAAPVLKKQLNTATGWLETGTSSFLVRGVARNKFSGVGFVILEGFPLILGVIFSVFLGFYNRNGCIWGLNSYYTLTFLMHVTDVSAVPTNNNLSRYSFLWWCYIVWHRV